MTIAQISSLPNEILTRVAFYLKPGSKNYANFSCACKLFYEIANHNHLWKPFATRKGIKLLPEQAELKKRIDQTFKQALLMFKKFKSLSIESGLRELSDTYINLPKEMRSTNSHLPSSCYPSALAIAEASTHSFELDFITEKTPHLWQTLLQSSRHNQEEFMKVFYFYISSFNEVRQLEYFHHRAKVKFLIYSFLVLLSNRIYQHSIRTNINLIKNTSHCRRAFVYHLNPARWGTTEISASANPDDTLYTWLEAELNTPIELPLHIASYEEVPRTLKIRNNTFAHYLYKFLNP